LGELHDMWRRYRDQVEFFVVYIKEAHPEDGWISQGNVEADIHVYDPASDDERAEVAQTCALRLEIEIPMLLDGIENRVASAYGALPDRLYLIGRDGRVAYQGEKGPQGFKSEELLAAIQTELDG
jgi:Iodothyronine deiodinase